MRHKASRNLSGVGISSHTDGRNVARWRPASITMLSMLGAALYLAVERRWRPAGIVVAAVAAALADRRSQ